MRIVLLQIHPTPTDATAAISQAEQLMQQTPEADLYVLPEMWATGFIPTPRPAMHQESMRALEWMKRTATSTGHAVAGSLAVMENADLSATKNADKDDMIHNDTGDMSVWRNRFFFVHPEGTICHYDKRHLFSPAGENRSFRAGQCRVTVDYKGVRFLLQTCFDLRFPESSRNGLNEPYDVALFTASWPKERRLAWHTLLQARAIENQAFTIGVNGMGGSAAFGPLGDVLAEPLEGCMQRHTIEISTDDFKRMEEIRRSFPVLE